MATLSLGNVRWYWWVIGILFLSSLGYGTVVVVKSTPPGQTFFSRLLMLTSTEEKRIASMEFAAGAALRNLISTLEAEGIRTFVGNTVRSPEDSARFVAEGKASAGLKHDWHTLGRAVDLYIFDPIAKKVDFTGQMLAQIRRMHEVAKSQGWESIAFNSDGSKHYLKGAKGPVWDAGHLQWTEGMSFEDAAATSTRNV